MRFPPLLGALGHCVLIHKSPLSPPSDVSSDVTREPSLTLSLPSTPYHDARSSLFPLSVVETVRGEMLTDARKQAGGGPGPGRGHRMKHYQARVSRPESPRLCHLLAK
jgi:hypothetical protein